MIFLAFINIKKVPREVLKTRGRSPRFSTLPEKTLGMLMNDKIMFDYYSINSTKHCKNEENIGALYFIALSHFPTQVRFQKYAGFRPKSSTHNLAHALRDAW